MKEKVSKGVMWNEAAKAGVVIGLVPVLYLICTQLVTKSCSGHAVIAGLINFLLWAAKFGGCIYLMTAFMKKFAKDFHAGNSDTFSFGCIVALCSSVIVAAASLANVLIFSSDLISSQFDTLMQSYSSALDANSMKTLDMIKDSLPQLTFFSNLIYCFLFGLVLSFILSRSIPPRNPFSDFGDVQDGGTGGDTMDDAQDNGRKVDGQDNN